MMTAKRRASAILALRAPRRLAIAFAHAFSQLSALQRVIMTLAAS